MECLEEKIRVLEQKIQTKNAEIFQLRTIIENLPGSIYWKNKDGVYLNINKTSAESMRIFNFPWHKEDIIGKTDYDLFPKDMADAFRKHDLEVMESEKESIQEEIATLPSGDQVTQLSTKKPLYDQQGNMVGVIGNTVDITYLKKIESELRIAKGKAEESHLLKMSFIHNMEHDIRTPFNGILGLSKILWEQEQDPEKKEFLGYIVNSSEELLDFCNTILDFSKSEIDDFTIHMAKFSLPDLLNHVMDMELPAAKVKNLQLKLITKNIPKFVIGDHYRLTKILINLVGNAIKFTNQGYIHLTVEGFEKNHRNLILKFSVIDTGIGIPKEKSHIIYDKFTRLSPSNKGYYKGLGIGLNIVKRYISDMDGDLEVFTETDKGTHFIFVLPFKTPLLSEECGHHERRKLIE